MIPPIRVLFTRVGRRVPVPAFLMSSDTVVLMYHGTPFSPDTYGFDRAAFERHVEHLRRHYVIADDTPTAMPRGSTARPRVMLTFDDGFRNNAEVAVPILRRLGVPALFFISKRHTAAGRYLWFAYLRALEEFFPGTGFMFRGQFIDMAPGERPAAVARLREMLLNMRPHPTAMYDAIDRELPPLEEFIDRRTLLDRFSGMTVEQVQELAADPLFTTGGHTMDHPLLTRCTADEADRQIVENKKWLEQTTGTVCDAFAYPGSDYTLREIEGCRRAGFTRGFSENRRITSDRLETPRIGVYYPSLEELDCKLRWSRLIVHLRRKQLASAASRLVKRHAH